MNGVPEAFWAIQASELFEQLQNTPKGLTGEAARKRLKQFGPNLLKAREKAAAARLFLNQFKSPIVLILLFATSVSAVTQDWVDALIILAIVLGSTGLSFLQEFHANIATERLRTCLTTKVCVIRDGNPQVHFRRGDSARRCSLAVGRQLGASGWHSDRGLGFPLVLYLQSPLTKKGDTQRQSRRSRI